MKAKLLTIYFFIFSFSLFAQSGKIDTLFNSFANFNNSVETIAEQSDGKIIVGGQFNRYGLKSVNHLARLNPDGTLDPAFQAGTGPNNWIYCIKIQSDGKIIIAGEFTSFNGVTRNRIARLNTDGSLDLSFDPGTGPNATVNRIDVLSNGKIIAAGAFWTFNSSSCMKIACLNPDGTQDLTFNSTGLSITTTIYDIDIQADDKIIIGGEFTAFGATSINRIARLNTDGTLDNTFNPGTGMEKVVESVFVQPDGKILAGGNFITFNGTTVNRLTRLNSDGTVDATFVTGAGLDGSVVKITCDATGKILIAGSFSYVNSINRRSIARLNSTGSVDNTFASNWINANAFTIEVLSNGNIMVGGPFINFADLSIYYLAKLNSSGIIDPLFNAPENGSDLLANSLSIQEDGKVILGGDFNLATSNFKSRVIRLNTNGTKDLSFNTGTGQNGTILTTTIQIDGKIIIGGTFTSCDGITRNRVARLDVNGSVDGTFNPGAGASGKVNQVALQPDGKIIVAGDFTFFNSTANSRIVRLDINGAIDPSFNVGTGANAEITKVVLQPDGKILIAGNFTLFNGTARNRIARLNANGSIDASFNPGTGANAILYAICLQANNKILIGGNLTSYNGTSANKILRLNWDGSIDASFNPGSTVINGSINEIALQEDGKIWIGGSFRNYNSSIRNMLVRLLNNGSLDNSFLPVNVDGFRVKAIKILPEGKIIAAGYLAIYDNYAVNNICRIKEVFPPLMNEKNKISGLIFEDQDESCSRETGEKILPYYVVKAMPGNYYGASYVNGNYVIEVDSGSQNYTVSQILNSTQQKFTTPVCPSSSHAISVSGSQTQNCCYDFANKIEHCSLLNINTESTRRRRCMRNNTYVSYCNQGNSTATNVQVRVVFPSYVVPLSSNPTWASNVEDEIIYHIPSLAPGECGNISIIDSVICGIEEIRGLTQCTKAYISPKSNCIAEDPAWDRSSIKVSGICKSNNVEFTIENAGSGSMLSDSEYRVYLNDTLINLQTLRLNSGEMIKVTVNSNGKTVRLEADQHPQHPGNSRPRATIEGCGGNLDEASREFVHTVPQDDIDEDVAISCMPILDSYDPNDKMALPKGITDNNYIRNTDKINYTIRFQNTGSDTAYNVVIFDTLDENLDISTFIPEISSHAYLLNISGKNKPVLTFRFNMIKLPDSTRDKINSSGFIKFSINPLSVLPEGTILSNDAGIFFDYNSPIITNEVTHIIHNFDVSDMSLSHLVSQSGIISATIKTKSEEIKIYPNPCDNEVKISLEGRSKLADFTIYNLYGQKMHEQKVSDGITSVNIQLLPSGIYYYKVEMSEELISAGQLIKK